MIAVKSFRFGQEVNINNEFAELKEVGTLVSKYIVSILGVGLLGYDSVENKPTLRLFMEYCNEGSLKDYVKKFYDSKKYIPESVWVFCLY